MSVSLTLELRRIAAEQYEMAMQLRSASPPHEKALLPPAGALVKIPSSTLKDLADRPLAYGQELYQALFADRATGGWLQQAQAEIARTREPLLHIGLDLSKCPQFFHDLRWETLQDPASNGSGWALNQQLLFSRRFPYPSVPPPERRRTARSALIAIANPGDLADYNLTPILVDAEIERLHKALQPLHIDVLAQTSQHP